VRKRRTEREFEACRKKEVSSRSLTVEVAIPISDITGWE
jgi:hypothetical protein